MKEDGADSLNDEACPVIFNRVAKQRRDSIDSYQQAGRADLAAEEQAELDVIETFLPALADDAQTRRVGGRSHCGNGCLVHARDGARHGSGHEGPQGPGGWKPDSGHRPRVVG